MVGYTVEQIDGAEAKIVADEKQRQKFNPSLARETIHQFWHRVAASPDPLTKTVAKVVVELPALAPATTSVERLFSRLTKIFRDKSRGKMTTSTASVRGLLYGDSHAVEKFAKTISADAQTPTRKRERDSSTVHSASGSQTGLTSASPSDPSRSLNLS